VDSDSHLISTTTVTSAAGANEIGQLLCANVGVRARRRRGSHGANRDLAGSHSHLRLRSLPVIPGSY